MSTTIQQKLKETEKQIFNLRNTSRNAEKDKEYMRQSRSDKDLFDNAPFNIKTSINFAKYKQSTGGNEKEQKTTTQEEGKTKAINHKFDEYKKLQDKLY